MNRQGAHRTNFQIVLWGPDVIWIILKFSTLSPSDPELVKQFFDLFHCTFPEETREPDLQIWEELEGRFRFPVAIHCLFAGDELLGFARCARLKACGLTWVIHLAVTEGARGRGHGTQLMNEARSQFEPDPIWVEVEEESRAFEFYRRMDFSTVSTSYVQPALHPHTKPVPLLLMSSDPIRHPAQMIESFYRGAWELAADHPFVRQAILGARPPEL